MSEEADYTQILTHLYSRKASRKTFKMIRDEFNKRTGTEFCDVIAKARDEVIDDIVKIPKGRKGTTTRTAAFKLIDYTSWIKFCPTKKR